MPAKREKTRQTRTRRATAALPPRPRTHAFTGCLTCRERHVKCDLGQPSCYNCTRLKVSCEGYSRKYTWVPPKVLEKGRRVSDPEIQEEAEESQSSRRVLFSDEERIAMAVQMRDECCINASFLDLDRVLRELQEKVADAREFARIGPFGILPFAAKFPPGPPPGPSPDSSPQLLSEPEVEQFLEPIEQTERISTPALNLSLSQLAWGELDDVQAWDGLDSALVTFSRLNSDKGSINGDLFAPWDLAITSPSQNFFNGTTNALTIGPYGPLRVVHSPCFEDEIGHTSGQGEQSDPLDFRGSSPSIPQMPNTAHMSKIPPEARLLLDYYSSQVIELISMSPIKKPPWKTIHLPCAMSALAELLVHGEGRSFAKMALFYALLSISAFHLGFVNQESEENTRHWKLKGAAHKKTAQRYLRSALDKNSPKAIRGKYKEVLMSMLSMVTIGVFSGDMQDSQAYLIESETLIRTFGLPKPIKSLKVSKLHHIFSYLRIIHESTSLRGSEPKSSNPQDARTSTQIQDPQNPEFSSTMAQSASSRLAWIEEDEEAEDQEEDPLFVSIYQLPTTLLSLISQTSSLCKQLDSTESSTPDFARRCKIIEDRIFRWRAPENLSLTAHFGPDQSTSPDAAAKDVAAHLVNATYQALIVHFQRQIRNTNPQVLQHYVTTAADHLLAHEQLKQSLRICHAPFPWPGFIVGCEAYDVSARQKIDLYLKTVRCYNVGSVMEAEKIVYEVWRRQDAGQSDHRWEDVLKDWRMQVVLT